MANMVATLTYEETQPIKTIKVAWTSDDAVGTFTCTTKHISGALLAGITDPGATAPTANYDVTIKDDEGADVLGNCDDDLVDRHTSTTERIDFVVATAAGVRPVVNSKLTIAGANCGNAKTGQVIIHWAPGPG
jgi:hypothetical protein